MKRVLILTAAALVSLAPLAAAGQDRDHERWSHGQGRGHERTRGYDAGRYYRVQGRDDRDRGAYAPPGGYYDPRPEVRRREDPRNAPPPYYAAPQRGRAWATGQYLPPMYRGAVVPDPGRYRLRRPPAGYDWVGVGGDIYLMQRGTGLVLEAIPGGF